MRARPAALVLVVLCAIGTAACTGTPRSAQPRPSTPTSTSALPSGSPSSAPAPWPEGPWRVGTWPDPPDRAVPADVARRLDAEVHRWVEDTLLPGVTVAVVGPDGVWAGSAGEDGAGAPLRPDSAMAIGSITKTLTAAAVLRLAERGEVALDDPVAAYLGPSRLVGRSTLRQLLSHRSGIEDPGDEVFDEIFRRPDTSMSPSVLVREAKRVDEPGAEFRYANVNFLLLGEVVAAVSGEPLAAFVRRELLQPLGLSRLVVQDAGPIPPPRAAPGRGPDLYGLAPSAYLPVRSLATVAAGGGGAAGDAETVARWGYALFGGRVLSAATTSTLVPRDGSGYGLGVMDFSRLRSTASALDAVGHDGEITGYRSALAVFPAGPLAVVVLTPSDIDPLSFVPLIVEAAS